MSRRANTTLIGLFIVGAILLAVGAALLFGTGVLRDKSRFVMYFSGSVKGLSIGAPVNFRGVKIGTVTDIHLQLDPDTQRVQIPVYVELEADHISLMNGQEMDALQMRRVGEMIQHGLRAQLQLQNLLTGQLAIQLDMHPDTPITLAGSGDEITEIPTIPTPLQEFTRKLEDFPIDVLLHNVASAAEGLDRLVNNPDLPQAIRQFDQTLKEYSELSVEYRGLAQRLGQQSDRIATGLNVTLDEMRATLQLTQGLIRNGESVVNDSGDLVRQLRTNADRLTSTSEGVLLSIKASSDSANQLLSEGSPLQYQLSRTLEEVASSARALRILANTLEQNPESLIKGKANEDEK